MRLDPAVLFQPVQRRVERALVDLEDVLGKLADALRNAPAVHGFEGDGLQNQQVQRALDQIVGFTHKTLLSIVNRRQALDRRRRKWFASELAYSLRQERVGGRNSHPQAEPGALTSLSRGLRGSLVGLGAVALGPEFLAVETADEPEQQRPQLVG